MINLIVISLIVLVLNVPFGYWRANVKKLSLQWFLAIHIPVIFVIALRLGFHLGFGWYTYVALVTAFFLGQKLGSQMLKRIRRICDHATSCLVMDLLRCKTH
ncbi:MAG: hypothetical protein ABFS28_04515 [Bacteroidota bacterium]